MKKILGILICTLLIATAVPSMATILTEKQNLNASDGAVNQPPTVPTISGPRSGRIGITYKYEFTSTDPDNDKVEYFIEWGDGTTTTWTGLIAAGSPCIKSHKWTEQETYLIGAKVRDEHGLESDWNFLDVPMPYTPLILRLVRTTPARIPDTATHLLGL